MKSSKTRAYLAERALNKGELCLRAKHVQDLYWDTECAVCYNELSEPYEVLRVERLDGISKKNEHIIYQSEFYEFCSYECLLKWTWRSIIPGALYLPLDASESKKEIQRILEKIDKKKIELLRFLDE